MGRPRHHRVGMTGPCTREGSKRAVMSHRCTATSLDLYTATACRRDFACVSRTSSRVRRSSFEATSEPSIPGESAATASTPELPAAGAGAAISWLAHRAARQWSREQYSCYYRQCSNVCFERKVPRASFLTHPLRRPIRAARGGLPVLRAACPANVQLVERVHIGRANQVRSGQTPVETDSRPPSMTMTSPGLVSRPGPLSAPCTWSRRKGRKEQKWGFPNRETSLSRNSAGTAVLVLVLNIIPGLGCSPNRLTLIKWPPPRTSLAHSHVTIRLNRAVHMYRNMRNANMPDACC